MLFPNFFYLHWVYPKSPLGLVNHPDPAPTCQIPIKRIYFNNLRLIFMTRTHCKYDSIANTDIAKAKQLLAEAGYPDGFGLTIHAPNNRYVNDAKIAQAVAQMLSRVGIDTKVVAMPSSTFFSQATDLKFSFMLLGWSTGTGEASSSLKALLMTYNRERGFGTANRGRYSNGKVDALTEDALAIVDDPKREAMLQRATELAINDTGIIPLHFQVNLWATRDGITYAPRTDENTLAWKFKPRS